MVWLIFCEPRITLQADLSDLVYVYLARHFGKSFHDRIFLKENSWIDPYVTTCRVWRSTAAIQLRTLHDPPKILYRVSACIAGLRDKRNTIACITLSWRKWVAPKVRYSSNAWWLSVLISCQRRTWSMLAILKLSSKKSSIRYRACSIWLTFSPEFSLSSSSIIQLNWALQSDRWGTCVCAQQSEPVDFQYFGRVFEASGRGIKTIQVGPSYVCPKKMSASQICQVAISAFQEQDGSITWDIRQWRYRGPSICDEYLRDSWQCSCVGI